MLSLTFIDRFKIKDEDAGLTEPSGLVLSHDGTALWTVSDDTKRVFRLSLEGSLQRDRSFDLPDDGLEGITIEPTGAFLFTVREESNEIIKLDIAKRSVADRRRLADMAGYGAISDHFDGGSENKGLEGIAWNEHSGTLFTLKEGDPGLMIEVAPDLREIRGHAMLGPHNGFINHRDEGKRADYSGLCYDPSRAAFWIVSDRARRVYLYDPAAGQVAQSAALRYTRDGDLKQVKKAEGVAYDPATRRLYVVCDEDARLYVFEVRS